MPNVEASGTQTTVVGTEHTLTALTTNRSLVVALDLSNMVAGDAIAVRMKRKVLSSGTIRGLLLFRIAGPPDADNDVVISEPISAPHGATITLEQEAGAAADFPWSVESL
jgi:hypothetical protein